MKKRVVAVHDRQRCARSATASACKPRGALRDVRGARHRRAARCRSPRRESCAAPKAIRDRSRPTPSRKRAGHRATRRRAARPPSARRAAHADLSEEKRIAAQRIAHDLRRAHRRRCSDLGLGYLSLDRSTPTLSPGELQRLRLATQIRSNLFGVVYVLDEPSAGLHPADTEALLRALDRLKASGNSLFVVEHDLDVMRRADWIVDVGPAAGEQRRRDPLQRAAGGAADVAASQTRALPVRRRRPPPRRAPRTPSGLARAARRHAQQPAGPRRRVSARRVHDGHRRVGLGQIEPRQPGAGRARLRAPRHDAPRPMPTRTTLERRAQRSPETGGRIAAGMDRSARLVRVDQKPIGRTPRSNLATYTGLFDHVRKLFAATTAARAQRYDAGRFSFNVAKGRCETCEGEGFVMRRAALHAERLRALPDLPRRALQRGDAGGDLARGKNIADVLGMTVDEACAFFADEPAMRAPLARAARRRPRLPASRPTGDRAVRRRGAAHQARDRAAARRSAATRSTCSTSRPPACTRPTSSS